MRSYYVNTIVYTLFKRRLPGFLGDTVCHSERRLSALYRQYGFEFVREPPARRFWGLQVFIYHELLKSSDS